MIRMAALQRSTSVDTTSMMHASRRLGLPLELDVPCAYSSEQEKVVYFICGFVCGVLIKGIVTCVCLK